jgi:hypothetical protein
MTCRPCNIACRIAVLTLCGHGILAAASTPTQPEIDAVNAEIKSDDKGKQDAAIAQINDWINSAHPIRNIWVDWIPGLMKDGRNDEAADVALAQCEARTKLLGNPV